MTDIENRVLIFLSKWEKLQKNVKKEIGWKRKFFNPTWWILIIVFIRFIELSHWQVLLMGSCDCPPAQIRRLIDNWTVGQTFYPRQSPVWLKCVGMFLMDLPSYKKGFLKPPLSFYTCRIYWFWSDQIWSVEHQLFRSSRTAKQIGHLGEQLVSFSVHLKSWPGHKSRHRIVHNSIYSSDLVGIVLTFLCLSPNFENILFRGP